jgi:hypothetical protein
MYIEQTDKYSCAPIAVMNALKWAGMNCPYDLEWFQWVCRCECKDGAGTYLSDLDTVIKFFGLAERYYEGLSLKEIDINLSKGKAALITYIKKDDTGHSMLCVGRAHNHYKVVNYARNVYPVQQVRRHVLKYLLSRKYKKQTKSRIYFVEKL